MLRSLEACVPDAARRAGVTILLVTVASGPAAAAAGASSRPKRTATAAASGPESRATVKLLEPGSALACGETAQAKWQACQPVSRCSTRGVDPDVVRGLLAAIEARARERAGAACERAGCGAARARSGENHFECQGARRLCLTLTTSASCAPGAPSTVSASGGNRRDGGEGPRRTPAKATAARADEAGPFLDASAGDEAQAAASSRIAARRLPPFLFPARAESLDAGEFWYWKAPDSHGGGSQKYAYDLTSARYDDSSGGWSECVAGDDGKAKCSRCSGAARNEDCLIYGEPIHAMAPGRVIRCWRNAPENPRPGEPHPGRLSDPPRIGGGGNALVVEHDDGTVALYAHMKPGSIPKALCPHDGELMNDATDRSEVEVEEAQQARITAGQFLGRAGNSGKSSNPHLHAHVQDRASNGAKGVPLNFQGGMIADAVAPGAVAWARLDPNLRPSKTSVIWPDFSKGLKEIAYHGVRSESYQDLFDHAAGSGYQLEWIDGFELDGRVRFNVIFRPKAAGWAAVHNLDGEQYQREFDERKRAGFALRHVDSYTSRGKVLYAAVFVKDGGPAVAAYHGRSAEEHQRLFEEWSGRGFRARNVSVVSLGGKRYYTALYEKGGPDVRLKSALSAEDYQREFDANKKAGLHLAYVNAYAHEGRTYYSAIWTRAGGGGLLARHGMSGREYQQEWESAAGTAGSLAP